MERFAQELFDRPEQAHKAAGLLKGILEAHSPRRSDIAPAMPGNPEANDTPIQRFLAATDPQAPLLRLFDEAAPFIIGDPAEIPRRQASKTEYVGRRSEGTTLGVWLLVPARPYHGRALPCAFITDSEGTVNREATSRNLEPQRAFRRVKELLGKKPLVLDREFSDGGMFRAAEEEGGLESGSCTTGGATKGRGKATWPENGGGVFKSRCGSLPTWSRSRLWRSTMPG